MARSVTVISGTEGLGETAFETALPWLLLTGVAAFVFWSTLSLKPGSRVD